MVVKTDIKPLWKAFYTVPYPEIEVWCSLYSWLEDNCQGKFYTGFDWDSKWEGRPKRIVQFENKNDAVMFALKWT